MNTTAPTPETSDRLAAYRRHVLEHGKPPASVYRFCRDIGIGEADFYEHFSSLQVLEGAIWAERIHHVRSLLAADEEYAAYPPRQKVLAFDYTFLEAIRGQRSWYLLRFPRCQREAEGTRLRKFRQAFLDWAEPVADELAGENTLAERLRAPAVTARLLYAHFCSVLRFHLEDESESFERTDAYIEKTVRLFFDVAEFRAPQSALDLVRFLQGSRS